MEEISTCNMSLHLLRRCMHDLSDSNSSRYGSAHKHGPRHKTGHAYTACVEVTFQAAVANTSQGSYMYTPLQC